MSHDRNREVPLEAELSDAVREAFATPPFDEVDWEGLHGRIMAGAASALEPMPRASWWDVISGWSRRGVPLTAGAAAAAAAWVLLLGGHFDGRPRPAASAPPQIASVEDVLVDALPEPTRSLVLAATDREALINAVVYLDEEEW